MVAMQAAMSSAVDHHRGGGSAAQSSFNDKEDDMQINRTGSAQWSGGLKDGKGQISTQSGALNRYPYGFASRFEGVAGTNPEELIGAAHAGCFTMALSFALAGQGINDGTLETVARVKLEQDGAGFRVSRSDLELRADVAGISEEDLRRLAEDAKANCPISKLLKADMDLKVTTTAAQA
jgi:osmotically inducible protein OsmC